MYDTGYIPFHIQAIDIISLNPCAVGTVGLYAFPSKFQAQLIQCKLMILFVVDT